jgi:hypothetical protein
MAFSILYKIDSCAESSYSRKLPYSLTNNPLFRCRCITITITTPSKVFTTRRSKFSFNRSRGGQSISTNCSSNYLDFSCRSSAFRLSLNTIDLPVSASVRKPSLLRRCILLLPLHSLNSGYLKIFVNILAIDLKMIPLILATKLFAPPAPVTTRPLSPSD